MGVFRVPVGTGLAFALAQIGLGIAGVFVLGLIVDALAPKFGAEKSKAQALKVVVYSFTPGWVAGVLGLLPALGILGLVALGYGIYLLYLGLPRLMKCPPDKAVTYTVVTVLCGVGVMFVISLITGAILATGMVATGALPGLR